MSLVHVPAHDRPGRGRRRGVAPGTMTSEPDRCVHLLHGVGMWPGLFDAVAERFARPHVVAARPGYGGRAPVDDLDGQVAAVAEMLTRRGPGVIVGVSGGATVALAAAIAGVPGIEGIVGPLVPTLHERVAAAGAELASDPGSERVDAFLAGLYGDGWTALPASGRRWVAEHRSTIGREVAQFASFAPSRLELAGVAVPHLTTVGRRSDPERHRVAALLASCGARVEVIEAAGHLVVVDDPDGFADAIDGFLREVGVA